VPSKKSRAFIDKDLHHLTAEVGKKEPQNVKKKEFSKGF
jgi:hypothetical protein